MEKKEKRIKKETLKAALEMTVTAVRFLRICRDIEPPEEKNDHAHFSHDVEEDLTRSAERLAEEIIMITEGVPCKEHEYAAVFDTARKTVKELLEK
jgi:hypothetical protein